MCPGTRRLDLCQLQSWKTTSETSCLACGEKHPSCCPRPPDPTPPEVQCDAVTVWAAVSQNRSIRDANEEMTSILTILGKLLGCCFVWLVCRFLGLLSKTQLHHTRTEAWLKITPRRLHLASASFNCTIITHNPASFPWRQHLHSIQWKHFPENVTSSV